ncbi:type VII secretion-associated serine protease mycosin [Kitasatospora sp. NPDC047058]|uniref:type VII secretion-associated serine protease mycosin n=1 Tax=Kitasatospora sp. NPDC047058 TaxID=3155620 RepID=UPI0033DF330A
MADQVRDAQWILRKFDVEKAVWSVSQGEGVTVAVVDSGVMPDHPDLTGQVLPGTDFSGGKTDGRVDAQGHGTAIASLIAGHGHGTQAGVMGLAPKARILPIRVRTNGESPELAQSDVALAVRYAVDHGAKVVNLSLGGYSRHDSQARAAIEYAASKDVVLVAATGNSGDTSQPVEYPAALPGVVAVGAVDEQGKLWEKSNTGPETTLVAPGVDIYHASPTATSGYGVSKGTSDAVAYVSATAALIRSKYPGLSAGQVINRIIKSATPPPDGSAAPNDRYGYGLLAPAKALEPNPAVDSGPKENPLLSRAESQGAPSADPTDETAAPPVAPGAGAGGNRGITYTLVGAGVLAVLVAGGVGGGLAVRARRRRAAAAAGPYPQGYAGYPPPPPQRPYQ